jgi:hypothetical protein
MCALLVILLASTTVFLGLDNLFYATISTFTTEELIDQYEIMKDAKVGQIVKHYIE